MQAPVLLWLWVGGAVWGAPNPTTEHWVEGRVLACNSMCISKPRHAIFGR
jgi:hypothetical protein